MTAPSTRRFALLAGLWLVAVPALLRAQPSGGPYGPVPQAYAVPKAAHVYFVAPDGKPEASGATLAEPTTLESAIEKGRGAVATVLVAISHAYPTVAIPTPARTSTIRAVTRQRG